MGESFTNRGLSLLKSSLEYVCMCVCCLCMHVCVYECICSLYMSVYKGISSLCMCVCLCVCARMCAAGDQWSAFSIFLYPIFFPYACVESTFSLSHPPAPSRVVLRSQTGHLQWPCCSDGLGKCIRAAVPEDLQFPPHPSLNYSVHVL